MDVNWRIFWNSYRINHTLQKANHQFIKCLLFIKTGNISAKITKKISFANALILKEGTKIGDLYPSLIRGSLGGLESPGIIDTSRA